MIEDLQTAFKTLKDRHGSHNQAATALGIAPDHYRKMRNGRANTPKRTAEFILMKAAEIKNAEPIPPQAAPVTPEARV